MIEVKCSTPECLSLSQMTPFQGDLKRRTAKDVEALAFSIETEGMLMPFAVWESEGKNLILDGHGRYQALTHMALNDASVLEQKFPVLRIVAENEEEARKALLQISSQYGKITKTGLINFTAPITGYKCPATVKLATPKAIPTNKDPRIIIRVRVDKEKAEALIKLLNKTEGCEVI